MDSFIAHNIITNQDKLLATCAFFVLGGWSSLILTPLFIQLIGKRLPGSQYKTFLFRNWSLHKYAAIAGVTGAIATLSLLKAAQDFDPGILIGVGSMQLLCVAGGEILLKRLGDRGKDLLIPCLLAIGGTFALQYDNQGSMSGELLWLVFLTSNILYAISEISAKEGIHYSEAINLQFWRFLYLTIFGTLAVLGYVLYEGKLQFFLTLLSYEKRWEVAVSLVLLACFVFTGGALKMIGQSMLSVTIVLMIVLSVAVIDGLVVTGLAHLARQDVFGPVPSDIYPTWVVRIFGAAVLIGNIRYLSIKFLDLLS